MLIYGCLSDFGLNHQVHLFLFNFFHNLPRSTGYINKYIEADKYPNIEYTSCDYVVPMCTVITFTYKNSPTEEPMILKIPISLDRFWNSKTKEDIPRILEAYFASTDIPIDPEFLK